MGVAPPSDAPAAGLAEGGRGCEWGLRMGVANGGCEWGIANGGLRMGVAPPSDAPDIGLAPPFLKVAF